jgi:hypothetical protein
MIIYHLFSGLEISRKMPSIVGWLITSFAIAAAFVIFRAENIDIAMEYFRQALNFNAVTSNVIPVTRNIAYGNFSFLFIFITLVFMFWMENRTDPKLLVLEERRWEDWAITIFVMICIIFFGIFNQYSFIYFQF